MEGGLITPTALIRTGATRGVTSPSLDIQEGIIAEAKPYGQTNKALID
jgi:hypothetical protein